MVREVFYDEISGLEGIRYDITFAYTVGDLASLVVDASGLSGIGVQTTVSEVRAFEPRTQSLALYHT